jgi:hypothetical protein
VWAVASGCIPVLFRSSTHDFWSGLLDYSAFAIVVNRSFTPPRPSPSPNPSPNPSPSPSPNPNP